MPTQVPISACYDATSHSIYLMFLQNLEITAITVSNLTTGDISSFVIDTSIGYAILNISGDIGIYQIEFALSTGVRYEGEFEITY